MIELDKVSYTYPFQDRPAVRDITLTVAPGEAVLVTGASGCGKSTLVRLVNGLCPLFFKGKVQGEIRHNGSPSQGKRLREISELVGTVFQDPELQFFALNVEDELAFAHEWQGRSRRQIRETVDRIARRMGITHLLGASIHDLSEGQKQKVALGSVLSLAPGIVVLDEPSANLDPESTAELARVLGELKRRGLAVLVADHRLYWLEKTADRVLVMDQGRIAAQGDVTLLADPGLRQTFGLRRHQVADVRHTLPSLSGSGAIQVKDLTFAHKNGPPLYENLTFSLPRGVTGIIGDNGTGKTTLARLITGLTRMRQGRIYVDGQTVSPGQMLKRSGLILQNTDHQLHMNSVIQELAMAAQGMNAKAPSQKALGDTLGRFGLTRLAQRHPQSLSGGEKQRLVIACGLAPKPDILILDEPTSGLDGRNMKRIARMIREAGDQGVAVAVITHDLELLAAVCDSALHLPVSVPHKADDTTESELIKEPSHV